jgi:WD40 repeat protein
MVNAVAFSPDGSMVAAGSDDRSVWIWDVASGDVRLRLEGHGGWVRALAFHPARPLLATGDSWGVYMWDIESGVAVDTLTGHEGEINDLDFSPAGSLLASAGEDAVVTLWPIGTD